MTAQYSSRILVLPNNPINPSADLPKLYLEPLDFAGALMLLDPSHPWDATQTDTSLQNNLWGRALETLNLTDQSAVGGSRIAITTQGGSANRYSERTSKKAIHLYYSDAIGANNANVQCYKFPTAILNHLKDTGNEFYVGLSHYITRNQNGLGSGGSRNQWSGLTYNDTGYVYSLDTDKDRPTSSESSRTFANRVGTSSDATLGLVHRSIGFKGRTLVNSNGVNPMFGVGRNSNWTNTGVVPASSILYTLFICDLTVANKTAAEVDAIFQARQAALFAANGRYADDTWIDPATK